MVQRKSIIQAIADGSILTAYEVSYEVSHSDVYEHTILQPSSSYYNHPSFCGLVEDVMVIRDPVGLCGFHNVERILCASKSNCFSALYVVGTKRYFWRTGIQVIRDDDKYVSEVEAWEIESCTRKITNKTNKWRL